MSSGGLHSSKSASPSRGDPSDRLSPKKRIFDIYSGGTVGDLHPIILLSRAFFGKRSATDWLYTFVKSSIAPEKVLVNEEFIR